jgi:hypothetical protein
MISKRTILCVLGVFGAAFIAALPARAQITVNDSARGWLTSVGNSNGNLVSSSYFAGYQSGTYERDHFDFAIPKFNGTLLSVTLELTEPALGHAGAPTTYTVYSLGAFGSYVYSTMRSGTVYGTTSLNVASDLTVVDIVLDPAAIAAITADQGGTFSLSGVDSGDLSMGPINNYDFAATGGASSVSALVLSTSSTSTTPEPSSFALFVALGTSGIALCRRSRKRGVRKR